MNLLEEQLRGRVTGIDPVRRGIWVDISVEAAYLGRTAHLLTLVCAQCGGGRRAHLGDVWDSPSGPLLVLECVTPPRKPKGAEARHDGFHEGFVGWSTRGRDDNPIRVYLLDAADDYDLFATFCPVMRTGRGAGARHGWRGGSVRALRQGIEEPGKRRVMAL